MNLVGESLMEGRSRATNRGASQVSNFFSWFRFCVTSGQHRLSLFACSLDFNQVLPTSFPLRQVDNLAHSPSSTEPDSMFQDGLKPSLPNTLRPWQVHPTPRSRSTLFLPQYPPSAASVISRRPSVLGPSSSYQFRRSALPPNMSIVGSGITSFGSSSGFAPKVDLTPK